MPAAGGGLTGPAKHCATAIHLVAMDPVTFNVDNAYELFVLSISFITSDF